MKPIKENKMTTFDPTKYKETTREQWQAAAEAWYRWEPKLEEWLGQATELMLDVAAGAGGQTIAGAKRVGPSRHMLATDISSNILEFAEEAVRNEGLNNIETRVLDGESLE